jgi:acetylornithine deacetylase/succinyl-diaminopimelate desuccinylase-like protein
MVYSKLQRTLHDLVSINSVNPAYPQGRGEEEIQNYIGAFFTAHALATFEQSVMPARRNVVGRLPGRNGAPLLVFEAHGDTAGVDGMDSPFRPEVRAGRLYGRGACDTKAGLAAMMWALAEISDSGVSPGCEVWVVSTVDEEHSFQGVLKLRESLKAAGAVVAEPTQLKMVVASKGCVRARITVKGRAAHSSKPELGLNAITLMARLLCSLETEREHLARRIHPLVGSPTLSVGLIQGGTQVNIVPADCTIAFDRRLIPGEDPDDVLAEYSALLDNFKVRHPEVEATLEAPMVKDWPLETALDSPVARCAASVLRGFGLDPGPAGVPFGSDASKLSQSAIPSIIFGPGSIDQAHTSEEYVELEQVDTAFDVYRKIMTTFE